MTSRLTMALHALGMIAAEGERRPGHPVTSEALAASINTNPVVVRRVLADLRRAGLVETRRGVGGGVVLARPPGRISLRAVWEALESHEQLFGRHPSGPNPACPVGRCVAEVLERLYGDAEAALKASLGERTLADLHREVSARLAAAGVPCERAPATRVPHATAAGAAPRRAAAAARRVTARAASPALRQVRTRAAP